MSEEKNIHEMSDNELSGVTGGGITIRISKPTSSSHTTISISKSGADVRRKNSGRKNNLYEK
jgi:bacteriocin-like protein